MTEHDGLGPTVFPAEDSTSAVLRNALDSWCFR